MIDEPDSPSTRKLRLCIISNPNSIHTRRWVNWFVNHGHTVCLLADVPLKSSWPGAPLIDLSHVFWAPIIRFPVWAVWLRRFIHRWQPDILHAHRVNSAGWLAAASGFHPRVVTPWGSDVIVGPRRSWVVRQLARYTLRSADLITTLSHDIGEQVVKLGAQPERLIHIQFGVELDIFNPKGSFSQEWEDLLRKLRLPENPRLVLSARALTPIYNQDIILKAIPLVRQHIPQVIFIFRDYNVNQEYKTQLLEIARQLDIEATIRWLPASSDRNEMAELYRMSDVVLSVPTSDGAPVSVLEAMACGKTVVASDLPSLREFIRNGENGWLVPVRQVNRLAEAIIGLLEHPELAQQFGQKCHQIVVEKANLDVEMQRMEAIYYQLIASRKG